MERAVGLILAVVVHAFALWGLWQHRLIPVPNDAMTLFVDFINPPMVRKPDEQKRFPLPKPKPVEKPKHIIVAAAAIGSSADYVAPTSPPLSTPISTIEAPVMPKVLPEVPLALTSELAVTCPNRTPPDYPGISRRFGEEGTVVLHVQLDETGGVSSTRVHKSSGFTRLDDAALSAVRTWRCNPAQRDGHAVKATALQPFRFVLQGS